MEKLKSIGTVFLGLVIIVSSLALVALFIGGASWLSEHLLPWFWGASIIVFAIIIFVLLPLSAPIKTRAFAVTTIYCASFLFGVTAWMDGLVITLDLWGSFAAILGIVLGGVGIVPIGLLAAMFHGMWSIFFELLALVILTFGCRFFAIWLGMISDKQSRLLEEDMYFPH